MHEHHTLGGRLTICLRDPQSGQVVLERTVDNVVTLAGRQLLAQFLSGAVRGYDQIQLVVGGPAAGDPPAPSTSDTKLSAPDMPLAVPAMPGAIVQRDIDGSPRVSVPVSGTLEVELGGPTRRLTEAGIQVTLPGGTSVLYNRVVFAEINKAPSLQMTLTWEVLF